MSEGSKLAGEVAMTAGGQGLGEAIEPIATAQATLFLACEEARYITGVTLNVNAGNLIV